jgi:apolipoprotein D and lipocalin family protein
MFNFSGCLGIPDGITPVEGLDLNRYLGTWYEIARFDHSFERGLTHVTATYTLREDGGVNVLNKGFDTKSQKFKEAKGRAYPIDNFKTARLKVSFFRPFYGAYNVFALDTENYEWAVITSSKTSYLWILSRNPVMDETLLKDLVQKCKDLGFDTEKIIYVEQGKKI